MSEKINPSSVPQRTLSNGQQIPCMGMGTFGSDRFTPEQVSQAVAGAIRCGYRLFDCASVYGNEDLIGKVFAEAFADGTVKREEMFITSKVWNDQHGKGEVLLALAKTLRDLQLDYIDFYFMHWPFANYHAPGCDGDSRNPDSTPFSVDAFMATWRQMEKLCDNCYYDKSKYTGKGEGMIDDGATITSLGGKTAEEAKSGAVTYLLNGSKSTPAEGETLAWYQTIDTDDYPTLDVSHKKVYQYTNAENKPFYSNRVANSITTVKVDTPTYDGNAKALSTEKGVNFSWNGSGAVDIKYYTDKNGTLTTQANSGASADGGAPVLAGTYYVKVTAAQDEEYLQAVSDYVEFIIAAPIITKNTIQGHSLTLNGDIGVNFYAELTDEVIKDTNAVMELTCAGKTTTVKVSEAVAAAGQPNPDVFNCA